MNEARSLLFRWAADFVEHLRLSWQGIPIPDFIPLWQALIYIPAKK
jgi:hypothetical protein